MRAHHPNTSRRAVVARRAGLILAAALAAAVGACGGGGSDGARALLDETFASHAPITSGRIDLRLALATAGTRGTPGAGLALRLRGPFQSLGPNQLPRFALQVDLRVAGLRAAGPALRAGATSTGGRLFIELDGTQYLAPPAVLAALRRGYAAAGGGAAARRPSVVTLGLNPGAWLEHPMVAGSARVAGVKTTHIVAGVDVARFLADVRKLLEAGAPLLGAGARGGGARGTDALSPTLSGAARPGRADIYTGASDHLLRRLALRASTAPGARAAGALDGSGGSALGLTLELGLVNQPQAILAPMHPRPLGQLPAELKRLGLTPAIGG